MFQRKRFVPIILIIIGLTLLLSSCIATYAKPSIDTGEVKVHYIDVGQGDSILIESGDNSMLIDAGENDKGNLVVSYIQNLGISKLDYVVATHPHSDHIGGLDTVLDSINVENVILPKVEHTTKTYEDFLDAIIENDINAIQPIVGTDYKLGEATFTVAAPSSAEYEELNNYSVCIKLLYEDTSFLFVGDAEVLSEDEMLSCGVDISADVLKIGHHGSNSSTSTEFLNAVDPDYAVICVGENNYGHPTPATLEKLADKDVTVFMTSTEGTVVAASNGSTITFNKTSSNTNSDNAPSEQLYIGNKNSRKFHLPTCHSLPAKKNQVYFDSRDEAIEASYDPCGECNP